MNRWRELSDGSWMCTCWDVLANEWDSSEWQAMFIYDKRPINRTFKSPQDAMAFVDRGNFNDRDI